MNRIILIGNGFDLAHGLATRYGDFINKFWKDQVLEAMEFKDWKVENGNFVFENKFFELRRKEYKKYTDIATLKQDISYYKNSFLERIEKARVITNWVDLEELYYRELLSCLKIEKENNDVFVVSLIKKLNEDFESIRANFEDYLKTNVVNEITKDKKIDEIDKHIWKELKNGTQTKNDFIGKVLFLNFNYTATEKLYTKKNSSNSDVDAEIDTRRNEVIHIHGVIEQKGVKDDEIRPMIFGYGDELAVDFKDIENTNRNEFLENAKSIKYLETDNYDRLLDFIKADYEVFIFGHSCGLSDRTLLNTIFENERCKKIKPFFHQENPTKDNFSEMTKNISRNFIREKDAKSNLRDKVEKKKNCFPLYYEGKIKADLKKFLEENFVDIDVSGLEYALLEEESRKQKIDKFSMGKCQVTQAFYMQIMGCKNPSDNVGEKLPVEQISWYDCVEFCNKLSDKYGLKKYYNINGNDVTHNPNGNGFRLPTENEWEYTARYWSRKDKQECKIYAGSTYHKEDVGGNIIDDDQELGKYAWFSENSKYSTHEVGTVQKAEELAIYDMSGNVWEWCEDLYDESGSYRVLRGGSWYFNARYCRVSYRFSYSPDDRHFSIGFRLALGS
ncbi:MAG: SUMF1/EgtB/PvdO family nonheme iron enzyme [Bacteroidales bacterium]|nr:SUMF1/EgtB/PvdO family nonheme iron enzyme [Bacteroidales bacterium]